MSACSKESHIEPASGVDYKRATWILRSWSLGLRSDYSYPNPFALTFRVLQPRLLSLFLRLEGLRKRRKLAADVLEEQPPLDNFGPSQFIAQASPAFGM